ncbi:methyltransferase domain-containing protein [candidate division WOR-3 bacterium]|nr:methyltransferase domain-containing protein [candidate division WOR-3 bacterium]
MQACIFSMHGVIWIPILRQRTTVTSRYLPERRAEMNKHDKMKTSGISPGSPRRCGATSGGEKEWWMNFFDTEWKRFSFDAHTPEHTAKQVDFIIEKLGLEKDHNVLDLACGIGRHALELSRRGFRHVTGQDFCQEYLDIAAKQAEAEGLKTEFLNSDIRRIPGYANLDAIYCWHTSFGYFKDEAENERVADAIGGALKQGGLFLLDTINRDWVVRNLQSQGWHGEAPYYILEKNRFDLATSTHHGEWTFISEDGKTHTKRMQLRQYSLHELIELFARYGLRFNKAWGSVDGDEFTMNSRRMIILFSNRKGFKMNDINKSDWGSQWWTQFFDDSYGRMGLDVIDTQRTQKEVDFIAYTLELKKDERILDLACGKGRHALELARRGFTKVTGLDLTEDYLNEAKKVKAVEDLKVRFIAGDMRDIPFQAEFDAAYNYFTSFGFFADDKDNEKVIASVSRTLKPGGRILIETINRDRMVRHFRKLGWYERGGEYVLKSFDIDLETSTLISEWTYLAGERKTVRPVRIRMYSLHEMISMLQRNGLEYVDSWGNKDIEPLTLDNHRLILMARKED